MFLVLEALRSTAVSREKREKREEGELVRRDELRGVTGKPYHIDCWCEALFELSTL